MSQAGNRRPHRGRGDQRPCDVCRKRKVRCVVRDTGICDQCSKIQVPCTFDDPPRSYGPRMSQPPIAAIHASSPAVGMEGFAWDDDAFFSMVTLTTPDGLHQSETASPHPIVCPNTSQFAVAHDRVQSDAFLLGPSSDPDPFFRGRYAFDDCGVYQATLRRYQKASEADDVLFAITPHHRVSNMADGTTALPVEPLAEEMLPFTPRLYQLFDKFVFPVFPLAVRDTWRGESSTLSAAVCATALSWRSHDTTLPWAPFETARVATEIPAPDASRLYRFAWACISREMHAPSYETVQAALLLVERRIPLTDLCDSPFNSCLQASITSMAFSLGLNRSPDSWSIHTESQKQRRRMLWWLIFVEDKWISAATGKPASIRDSDYDVAAPSLTFTGSLVEVQFEYLLCLTFILQDILDTIMYLLLAPRITAANPSADCLGIGSSGRNPVSTSPTPLAKSVFLRFDCGHGETLSVRIRFYRPRENLTALPTVCSSWPTSIAMYSSRKRYFARQGAVSITREPFIPH